MVPANSPGSDHGSRLRGPDGLTVHLVGRLTPSVLSFLLPAIQVLRSGGRRQALLFISDGACLEQMGALPADVERVPVRDSDSPSLRCDALFKALRGLWQQHQVSALHLHGLLPGLAAARLLRQSTERGVDVFLSPHSSRMFGWPILKQAIFERVRRADVRRSALHVIVNLQREARFLAPFDGLAVRVIECPVPQVFFDAPRREARRPLLISCSTECQRAAIDGFLRLAVLLNDDRLGISFNWIGKAEAENAAALRAAGIGCFEPSTDASRAVRLSTAWIYVAAGDERGFPIRLAEAMAAGVPCVALDTEVHREMIVPGQTGYLYADLRELLERIGQLVDSEDLRRKLGGAARQVAIARFGEAEFRLQLLHAVSAAPDPMDRPEISSGDGTSRTLHAHDFS